jgi:hypothetical protein
MHFEISNLTAIPRGPDRRTLGSLRVSCAIKIAFLIVMVLLPVLIKAQVSAHARDCLKRSR